MDAPKRRSALHRAQRSAYACIEWTATDVQTLRTGWNERAAVSFLAAVEERLAAETLAAGWRALGTLLAEYERAPDQNGDDHE